MDGSNLDLRWAWRPALAGGAIGLGGFLLFVMSATPAPAAPRTALTADTPKPVTASTPKPVTARRPFRDCVEARAAGHAPVYAGDPGYGPWLDGDDDGIGCEPHRRR